MYIEKVSIEAIRMEINWAEGAQAWDDGRKNDPRAGMASDDGLGVIRIVGVGAIARECKERVRDLLNCYGRHYAGVGLQGRADA